MTVIFPANFSLRGGGGREGGTHLPGGDGGTLLGRTYPPTPGGMGGRGATGYPTPAKSWSPVKNLSKCIPFDENGGVLFWVLDLEKKAYNYISLFLMLKTVKILTLPLS